MPPRSPLMPARTGGPRGRRRRRRVARRAFPILVVAAAAFAGGAVTGARHVPADRDVAQRFLLAYQRADYGAMHALLAPEWRRRVTLRRFSRAFRAAAATTTLERARAAGRLRDAGERRFEAPMRVQTRLFGTLRGTLVLRVAGPEETPGVAWRNQLVFPGLRPGEELAREIEMPRRADLLARDGTPIAEGEARTSGMGPLAAEIAGRLGPIPAEQAEQFARRGYPPDATVGLNGLEREFEADLAGSPGGTLRAGARVLARARPRAADDVRTSIDPDLQAAAVEALAGRFGGVAVIRPRTGEVLGLAGIAFSAPQPPGSVFKIVTLAGALEEKAVKTSASFPVQTAATLEGVELENANGESCGGSLENSFAHSCNSVFAPLGAELGPEKLVAAAEAFGFNEKPSLAGAAMSTIPDAEEIGDDLAVGSTAIGQGLVQATPLHFAAIAATIANRGAYVRPTLRRGDRGKRTRAISGRTARILDRFMRAVVAQGTGTAAAIEGVKVAGKTGTAELRDSTPEPVPSPGPGEEPVAEDDTTDTNAWFVAYAPSRRPRVAVAVMLVGQGAGGATAAPAAKLVLQRAL